MPFGTYTCGVQWHIVSDGSLWLSLKEEIWVKLQPKQAIAFDLWRRWSVIHQVTALINFAFCQIICDNKPVNDQKLVKLKNNDNLVSS